MLNFKQLSPLNNSTGYVGVATFATFMEAQLMTSATPTGDSPVALRKKENQQQKLRSNGESKDDVDAAGSTM